MRKLFIYFSLTGNGDFLASILKEKGYEIIKIEMATPIGKPTFFKIIKYGGRAMFKKIEKLKDIDINLDDIEVVIGSPIWNDCLSTPIWTILQKYNFDKETTSFILYPAGKTTKKSFKQIAKLGYKKTPVVISYPLNKVEESKTLLESF